MSEPNRILIMEDSADTNLMLKRNIASEKMGWEVDVATTVKEAQEFVTAAKEQYLAAILDFKMTNDVDCTVCRQIRQRMPGTTIFHITAAEDDKAIELHLEDVHGEKLGGENSFAKDDENNWYNRVIDGLYRALLNYEMDNLSNSRPASSRVKYRSRAGAQPSLTGRLERLARDLIICWKHLDQDTKERAKRLFFIDESNPSMIKLESYPLSKNASSSPRSRKKPERK
jgi:CheY-like chemotaxis protein